MIRTTVLLIYCCLLSTSVYSQPSISGDAGVGQMRRHTQDGFIESETKSSEQDSQLILPPVEPEPSSNNLSSQFKVYIDKFIFNGNKSITDAELAKITAPYEQRTITSVELQQARNNVSLFYLAKGYINSGATLPEQKVENGIVQLDIVEGKLNRIDISGNAVLNTQYLEQRLQIAAGHPLNIKSLEQELQRLKQDNLINRVNAELRPGDRPGEALLVARFEENQASEVDISFNNHRPPSVGAEQIEINAVHHSLSGRHDSLAFYLGHSAGLDDVLLSYQLPINAADTRIGVYGEYTESEVIEQPFNELGIESDAHTLGISITHPLLRLSNGHLLAGIALEQRTANTYLFDVPFSFADGVQDGRAMVTPLRLSIDWLERSRDSVMAIRSTLSFGLDAFDATLNGNAPDGRFTSWLNQIQWVKRLDNKGRQLTLKGSAQFSNDGLLPMEKFVIGGHSTVRGYRENQIVRDNGYILTAELKIPLSQSLGGLSSWQFIPFIDYGNAWEDANTPDPRDLGSAGFSILWQPKAQLQASITAARGFENIDNGNLEQDLQDNGIHFSLNYKLH